MSADYSPQTRGLVLSVRYTGALISDVEYEMLYPTTPRGAIGKKHGNTRTGAQAGGAERETTESEERKWTQHENLTLITNFGIDKQGDCIVIGEDCTVTVWWICVPPTLQEEMETW